MIENHLNDLYKPFRCWAGRLGMGRKLLLLKEVDDLVAVLGAVALAGDMDSVDVAVAECSNSESLKCGDKSKSFIVV